MKKQEDIVHMVGGTGSHSYDSNSTMQENGVLESKTVVKETIKQLLSKLNQDESSTALAVADLGCSTGANAFLVISHILDSTEEFCNEKCAIPPEIVLFLNDLPGNDFNTLLGPILTSFKEKKKMSFPFYTVTMPGSFYSRLFPRKSIHFFHSSYTLMWLSQAPLSSQKTCAINKGNIYITKTSPPVVFELYMQQFKQDFCSFLELRSEELCSDVGYMVLVILGRKQSSDPSKETFFIFICLTQALEELVSKGKVKASDVDAFNMPVYFPSMEEVKQIIEENGSFEILHDIVSSPLVDKNNNGKMVADATRAAYGPIFAAHFGDSIIDELFSIMMQIYTESYREENNAANLTISLKKKK